MKTVIIGQAPSRVSDPSEPLSGRSGARLASLAGVDLPAFREFFDRRNMLSEWPGKAGKGDAWPGAPEARAIAEGLRTGLATRRVVLLGVNVARAFGFPGEPFLWARHWEGVFAFSPHPSGTNRWWNDRRQVEQARRFWRSLVEAPGP